MSGLFIAAVGLPGSGKSTVCDKLARLCGAYILHEPEEEEWPLAVKQRNISGNFGAIMWFRSIRVPLYYEAMRLKDTGHVAIVDSYYDKLFTHYMHREGMEWLIDSADPYFSVMSEIATLDAQVLPNADCIVSFEVDYDDWITGLGWRGRALDADAAFLRSYDTQQYFVDAARIFAKESGAKLVRFKQRFSTPAKAAELLREELRNEGIVL